MMRPSLLPSRQANRICAFCRKQQLVQSQQHSAFHTSLRTEEQPLQRCDRPSSSSPTSISRHYHNLNVGAPPNYPQKQTPSTRRWFSQQSAARRSNEFESEPKEKETTTTHTNDKPKTAVPKTHYEFFPKSLPDGPPPKGRFGIDVRALRREFLSLQSGAHPDLHPAHMKARAQATSARINEAFKTLENPLLRAQYILSLRGIDVANDETAKVEDPELLMLVLEARERIEDAQEEDDLEELKVENDERISVAEDNLEEYFKKDDLAAAKEEVTRLRYWNNVRESINNWEKGKPIVLEH